MNTAGMAVSCSIGDENTGIQERIDIACKYDTLVQYATNLQLLLKDLEFLLLEEASIEEKLASYAITIHGIKLASFDIGATQAALKAEKLENAARAGKLEFVEEHNELFLKYMDNFITALEEVIP
jgi:hypothetical protein